MAPTTLVEKNCRRHQMPLVCAISIGLDGCEPAYLDVAIECGLMPNSGRVWQNGASQIAHSMILSYRKPNSNKTDMDRGVLPRNKIFMTFCSRNGVAHMRNELRESLATAYRT